MTKLITAFLIIMSLTFLATPDAFANTHCAPEFDVPPDHVSIAWVAPVGKRIWFRSKLNVVRTSELSEYLGRGQSPTVARLLQVLGRRKSNRDPWKRYTVTIFDVPADLLCRAIVSDEVTTVAGINTCRRPGITTKRKAPCGYAVDKTTGQRTVDRFRISWSDAAANGFCVLPAQRYLNEGL